jgi:hypothetical protein
MRPGLSAMTDVRRSDAQLRCPRGSPILTVLQVSCGVAAAQHHVEDEGTSRTTSETRVAGDATAQKRSGALAPGGHSGLLISARRSVSECRSRVGSRGTR